MEFKNLKINFLGDSITYGYGASDASKNFIGLIQSKHGAICRNYGVGGSTIAKQQSNFESTKPNDNFIFRAENMESEADLVCIFGGTNDLGHGDAPFGVFEDRSENTFFGALHTLCINLLNKYPKAQLMFITPMHRPYETNEILLRRDCNGILKPDLISYVNAIRQVAEYYSIPVLDLYKNSGIQPNVIIIRETYTIDGLHPNDLGYELLADKIAKFIQSL